MSGLARLASFRVATRQNLALGVNAWIDCRWASGILSTSVQADGFGVVVSK